MTPPASWILWQLPSFTFALFLVAMVAAITDLDGPSWWLLGTGLCLVTGATVVCVLAARTGLGRGELTWIPATDLVGAALINLVGAPHLSPTILLCALPALWLSFEFGRAGMIAAVVVTLVAAVSPCLLGLHVPSTAVGLLALATPTCTIVVLTVISGVLGSQLRGGQARLEARTREARCSLELAQDRLVTMNGVLAAVDAAVAVLLTDEPPICNRTAVELAAKAGIDLRDARGRGTHIYRQDGHTRVPAADQAVTRALDGEQFSEVLHWIGEPGQQAAIVTSARRLVRADGTDLGAVVTAWDATELLDTLRVREDFLATVSHELRTPLTSVIGYLEVLTDLHHGSPHPDERAEQVLSIVSRNASLMLDRIAGLFSGGDEPQTLHEPVRTDVTALLRLAMQKHDVGARAHPVQLDSVVMEGVVAHLDPTGFEQVVDNLVTNAIKFCEPQGHVMVQLVTHDTRLTLSVCDDGIGMTPDEQRQAFRRFYRTELATRSAIQGLGIGLGLVAAIVERHEGTVEIVSSPARGTTVHVSLPVAVGSEVGHAQVAPDRRLAAQPGTAGSST